MKIRNPKSEIRTKPEIRTPNQPPGTVHRSTTLIRISDFGPCHG
jgi:hypothetical protein